MTNSALAARMGDSVGAHTGGGSGSRFLSNALKWALIGGGIALAIVAAPVLIAGAATALGATAVAAGAGVLVGAIGGTVGATLAVAGGILSGAAAGIGLQKEKEKQAAASGGGSLGGGCSNINTGSNNVWIEGQKAARAQADTNTHGPPPKLNEGSSYVDINGKPACRLEDRSCCGGKIISSAQRTFFGGPPTNGGGDAAPINGPAFSITDLDTWNWDKVETGLNVAGFLLGFGVVKGIWKVGYAAWKVGGWTALKGAMKPMAKEVGSAVGGTMVMAGAGKQVGAVIGGAEAGETGSLIGEAMGNVTPWGRVANAVGRGASRAKDAAGSALSKMKPSRAAEAPHPSPDAAAPGREPVGTKNGKTEATGNQPDALAPRGPANQRSVFAPEADAAPAPPCPGCAAKSATQEAIDILKAQKEQGISPRQTLVEMYRQAQKIYRDPNVSPEVRQHVFRVTHEAAVAVSIHELGHPVATTVPVNPIVRINKNQIRLVGARNIDPALSRLEPLPNTTDVIVHGTADQGFMLLRKAGLRDATAFPAENTKDWQRRVASINPDSGTQLVSPEHFAKVLQRLGVEGDVRLVSCETGKLDEGTAARFAAAWKSGRVHAPTESVTVAVDKSDNGHVVSVNKGYYGEPGYRTFDRNPDGSVVARSWENGRPPEKPFDPDATLPPGTRAYDPDATLPPGTRAYDPDATLPPGTHAAEGFGANDNGSKPKRGRGTRAKSQDAAAGEGSSASGGHVGMQSTGGNGHGCVSCGSAATPASAAKVADSAASMKKVPPGSTAGAKPAPKEPTTRKSGVMPKAKAPDAPKAPLVKPEAKIPTGPSKRGIDFVNSRDGWETDAIDNRTTPIPGVTDVIVHGSNNGLHPGPTGSGIAPIEDIASTILAHPNYQDGPVRLFSCNSGNTGYPAMRLANLLQQPVWAPRVVISHINTDHPDFMRGLDYAYQHQGSWFYPANYTGPRMEGPPPATTPKATGS